jgi:hypothetical protein
MALNINVLSKSTFDFFKIDPIHVRTTDVITRAFNGAKVGAIGELELPIKIGPPFFNVDFHIIDTKSSYAMLLGRPWIHAAGAVPSSLHQKLKYVIDCCLIEVSAEQEYLIKQVGGPPRIGAAEAVEEEFLRGFEIVAVTPVSEGSKLKKSRLPKQVVSAAKTTIRVMGKQNLKRKVDESLQIIYPVKNEGTFGFGFKSKQADNEKAKAERRERKRAKLEGRIYNEPPMNISPNLHAFYSAGFINLKTDHISTCLIKDLQDMYISVIEGNRRGPQQLYQHSKDGNRRGPQQLYRHPCDLS